MGFALLCFTLLHLLPLSPALTDDGTLLLAFKYSVLSDPLSVLDNWAYSDPNPCSWTGVTCAQIGSPGSFRVISLVLPHSQLVGSVTEDLGFIENLRILDLSDNSLNGSLSESLFNHTELRSLSLANNNISGELPKIPTAGVRLQVLNLSNNALAGKLPENLPNSKNLTVISLKSNFLFGSIPSGFNFVEILDLSSNLLNGSLPIEFGGERLSFLNLSKNKLSGSVSSKFASKIPGNASIDLSFNNLSGQIPPQLSDRKSESFANNLDLCGKPLDKQCTIPSSISIPPNITNSTPAIAVIPKSIGSSPETNSTENPQIGGKNEQRGIKLGTIVGITVGDLAGIGFLGMIFVYLNRLRKRKNRGEKTGEVIAVKRENGDGGMKEEIDKNGYGGCGCIGSKGGDSSEEGVSSSNVSESDENDENGGGEVAEEVNRTEQGKRGRDKMSLLVMVDGETKLDLETLLKASAYILGSTGSSIVYKAVLQDGTAFAVRRIGEGGIERLRDFEGHVRAIAKLRHPNLVRIRGFYWGDDEKLIIYDYVSNGSLATSTGCKRVGSSPIQFSFELRLKIARGLASGLAYIHDRKKVHGNIKPSNILLTPKMDAVISDLGLDRLLSVDNHPRSGSGARHFRSRRSAASRDSLHMHDLQINNSPHPSRASFVGCTSAYHAPESFENAKPSSKWDVYSFGIIFLELLMGRVFSDRELGQWAAGPAAEDKNQVLRMADMAIRADMAGREDALFTCLRLGFGCASLVPQKRPSMKEVLQVIEKMP